ncbi:hypothetical protein ACMHYB_32990 [Sorangium sp. So ce1128]
MVLPQDACGVFVAHRGDDADEGTRKEPVRTLRRAVEKARNEGKRRVFACAEVFDEAVTLPSGIDLWGGRDCTTDEWGWPDTLSVTEIAPEPGRVPLQVKATQGIGTSNISAVRLVAADAIEAGASSIAMLATGGVKAVVTWSEIIAGNGADGAPGEDAPLERAQNGAPANHGAAVCSDELVEGGAIAVTACADGTTSVGGSGGVGERDAGGAGEAGEPAPSAEQASSEGRGGRGERATGACEPGMPGRDGAGGTSGSGALQNSVHLSSSGLHGARGQDGTPGGTAQGGGGGGGTRGRGVCDRREPQGGASGGSGGGGGCGGRAGKGGGAGGSSIAAVVVVGAEVEFNHTTLHAGRGGNGGAGGRGQQGGHGYPGGVGGEAGMNAGGEIAYACHGGHGGKGGHGGHGGGGLGGSSVGIAWDDSHLTTKADTMFELGAPGDGGLGGDPGGTNDDGQAGHTVSIWTSNNIMGSDAPPR